MKSFYLALSLVTGIALTPLVALASAGTVILAKGVVTATGSDNANRVLAKGTAVEEGDVIKTAGQSFAVIRMLDNSKLTLKPGTTLAIGKFSLEEGKEEACINLVRGGLRTVTGLIGKRKPKSFNVDTPIASIGIRGTDFITRICAGDECSVDEPEIPSTEFGGTTEQNKVDAAEAINDSLPEGMYSSCETGAIVMSQCAGQSEGFEIGKCRTAQVKDCTVVGLTPGQAGYTGVPVVQASNESAQINAKEDDSDDGESNSGRSDQAGSSSNDSQENGRQADSSEGSGNRRGGSGVAKKGSTPVVLTKSPDILTKDPYFALSDLSDQELNSVDSFPTTLSPTPTGGQCSI